MRRGCGRGRQQVITIRRHEERLCDRRLRQRARLTFNAQDQTDPLADGFGALARLDDVRLAPGAPVVGVSPLLDVEAETVTYLHKGALAQKDSQGNSGVIHAGEFQHMTTGRGIRYRETNASYTDWVRLFRIVLRPALVGVDCVYEHQRFTAAQRRNNLCAVASPDGRGKSLRVHHDALIHSAIFDAGHHGVHELLPGRCAWLHVLYGEATVNGFDLTQGDGAGITLESCVSIRALENTEVLLINSAHDPALNGAAGGPQALNGPVGP